MWWSLVEFWVENYGRMSYLECNSNKDNFLKFLDSILSKKKPAMDS